MSKHTKGPWEKAPWSDEFQSVRIFSKAGIVGFSANSDMAKEEIEANGRLIAAAPDMLEALNLTEQFIANGVESGYIVMPEENDPALETLSKIRAVIKKARGLA